MPPRLIIHINNTICVINYQYYKTVLYWLVNDMIVYEKPPETFFKISNLMRRLETNVDHIWLGRSDLSEAIKTKYYKLSKALNNYDCEILFKGLFAEAHYGEDRK